MVAGYNQTQVGAFTVPASKKALIKRVRVSIARANGSAGSATVSLLKRDENGAYQTFRVFELTTEHGVSYVEFGGFFIDPKADILARVLNVSDSSTTVDLALEYYLIDQ